MRSSYKTSDVILLLKDITGMVEPQPTQEREKLIQAGKHYCEMLPIEYVPSEKYMEVYRDALDKYSAQTAKAVGMLAERIVFGKSRHPDRNTGKTLHGEEVCHKNPALFHLNYKRKRN